ncbi:hypothetical protein [Streptomyces sp. NBC_01429]|uniref:hypothetical protein n=1 Tax=Streptomyces sp. NBC_01429 TaxID=2903862 RepID=UPI002E2CFE47|nr:hypothetical protein [Streptomyces sp. NBC_01429]
MAKHKNRDRGNKQHARSESERGNEESKSSSMEDRTEERLSHITPSDVAQKGRQKRFGHN